MKAYHKNPRQITKKELEQLEDGLNKFGDLGGIVHDLNSNEIIGGNQRSRVFGLMQDEGKIVIEEEYEKPTRTGTVAHGYIEWRGERYSYRQVRWTPEQCEEANVRANKAGGSWDWDILANEFEVDDLMDWGFEEWELGKDWGTPPLLDDLKDEYGEPGEEDFWPVIKVKVSPETMELWMSLNKQTNIDNESQSAAKIIGAVDATLLGNEHS